MDVSAISYRPGVDHEASAAFQVFRQSINDFYVRTGQARVADVDDQSPWYRHMMLLDGERFWVAERKRELVGFGAAIVRDHWWFLSCLFVVPRLQGLGVGRELLSRVLATAPPGGVRATITDAAQPVSNTLYARHGLLPALPLIPYRAAPSQVRGTAPLFSTEDDDDVPQAGSLRPEPLGESAVPELEAIDRVVLGFARTADHRHLVADGRRGWLFRRAGRPVAYAMYRANGWIGPLACVDEADVEPVLRHTLATVVAERPAVVWTGVPSPNVAAQRALVQAGFVYDAPPALLLRSEPFGDLSRYLPAGYGMM